LNSPAAAPTGLFEHLLTRYRGLFATLVLLPISVGYDLWTTLRRWLERNFRNSPTRHEERVQAVINQIQAWKDQGAGEKLCTARSGWNTMSELVPRYKLTHRQIRVDLREIVALDEENASVRVEPLATMGQLSRYLLARGWTLPVVPELDDLTVGGLIMGFGVETSSHKYGLFQHICLSLDVVCADGRLLRCGPEENSELFYLLPWSHGTLGFLVAAELRVVRATPWVRIDYQPVFGLDDIAAAFERTCRDTENHDFVEALVYDRESAVIMCGKLSDRPRGDGPVNALGRWYKPWFYRHVRTFLEERRRSMEYVPLRHYFHRHTRSYFWMMEEIIPFGNHPLFRILLGWALPPKISLLKYTETETTRRLRERYQVLQDMLLPVRFLKAAIEYFDEHFKIYPLWLSPMAIPDNPAGLGLVHPYRDEQGQTDELFVDVGAYGTVRKTPFDNEEALPALERFVMAHGGYQALYAKTCLSREDFRAMFDHRDYDRLRERLPNCRQAFDEIYDKVSTRGRVAPVEMRRLEKRQGRA
jgi:Delta24-sterol reductase